jgi:hypothetical protein
LIVCLAIVVVGVVALLKQHSATNLPPAVMAPAPGAPTPEAAAPPGKTLAIGRTTVTGGRTAGLVATSAPDRITIHSESPMPVIVSLSSGYGAPLRPWITLARGRPRARRS